MDMKKVSTASVVALLVLMRMTSAEDTVKLDQLVITATRHPAPQQEVGSSLTVIDHLEISRRRHVTALELLRTVPSVTITQSGGPGKVASALLRGGNASHTLILIDGVRVNATTTGSFDLADILSENIERIEVLRGNQSSLYGSEAMGGVINIITKKGADGTDSQARVEMGTHDHRRGTLSLRGGDARYDFSSTVSYWETDGVSAASEEAGHTEDDGYRNLSSSHRMGIHLPHDGRADLIVRYTKGKTDVDGFAFGTGPIDDPNFTQERETRSGALQWKQPIGKHVHQTLRLSTYDEELVGEDPDTDFNNFLIESRTTAFDAQSDIYLFEDSILSIGYTYERRHGKNQNAFDETRDVHSLFLQRQWAVQERLFLTAGARLDDYEQFGDKTTYRGTAAWLIPTTASRVHTSIGSGFKAPDFNQLFFPNFGNPDLKAETSIGFDAGLEQRFADDRVVADVTFFYYEFSDLIGLGPDFAAANVDEARTHGVETTLELELGAWGRATAAYTYTDTEDRATEEALPHRAMHQGVLNFFLNLHEHLTTTITLIAARDRKDIEQQPMDNYTRVDLSAAYTATKHLRPYVRIENLLDRSYEEIAGFTSPGFTGVVGVEATW